MPEQKLFQQASRGASRQRSILFVGVACATALIATGVYLLNSTEPTAVLSEKVDGMEIKVNAPTQSGITVPIMKKPQPDLGLQHEETIKNPASSAYDTKRNMVISGEPTHCEGVPELTGGQYTFVSADVKGEYYHALLYSSKKIEHGLLNDVGYYSWEEEGNSGEVYTRVNMSEKMLHNFDFRLSLLKSTGVHCEKGKQVKFTPPASIDFRKMM